MHMLYPHEVALWVGVVLVVVWLGASTPYATICVSCRTYGLRGAIILNSKSFPTGVSPCFFVALGAATLVGCLGPPFP